MFRFEGCVNKPRVGKIKITIIKNQKILKNLNFTPDLLFFAELYELSPTIFTWHFELLESVSAFILVLFK